MRNIILAAIAATLLFALPAWACLDAPLPTSPSGPTWTATYEDRLSSGTLRFAAEVTAWRYVCPNDEPLLFLTFDAVQGTPFVCSSAFDVIQGGAQYGNFRLLQNPGGSSFCGDLLLKSTFVVGQFASGTTWDDQGAFRLAWRSDLFLDVGAFDPAAYGQELGPRPFEGNLSGSWFDPNRSGEGLVLEFGEIAAGPVATLYWFTHLDGVPYWLIGSATYETGQTTIDFGLLEVSGTGFGDAFDPGAIELEEVGVLTLEFDNCASGFAAWEMHDGQSGSFDLERITAGLDRVSCPQ